MEILAALAGAFLGILLTKAWDRYSIPKRLLNTLKAELAANRQLCNNSLSVNQATLSELALAKDKEANTPIDDDLKVFVVSPTNISIETWINQDTSSIFRTIPIELLLQYKSAVMRVEYLVDRHRGFRFRPNFIKALINSHQKLLAVIDQLEQRMR